MARPPKIQLVELIPAAAAVFVRAGGYHRAQISDVARSLGVAKGTIYRFVESKEALFDLVLRHADAPATAAPALPVPTPPPGATAAHLAALIQGAPLPPFDQTPACLAEARDELDQIVDQLYGLLHERRWTIRLVNAAAADIPELGQLWFGSARGRLNAAVAAWLARRADQGLHRPLLVPPPAAARLLTELLHWFAVARCFDTAPDPITDDEARAAVRTSLGRTFLLPEVAP
jgi:AcrR family transcriptional regulator